ncbi:MAG: hypothetical protein KDH94_05415, partial [Coxiellaceae bacterium]|nr:hypothetical protein [Coxiellaceae bacterium]
MMEKARTWINLIAGLLAILIIIWLAPAPVYKARGILLPSENARAPISPDSVVLVANRPYKGQLLGHINIENHYPMPGN